MPRKSDVSSLANLTAKSGRRKKTQNSQAQLLKTQTSDGINSGRKGGGDGLLQSGQKKISKKPVADKLSRMHPPPPLSARGGGSGGVRKIRKKSNGVLVIYRDASIPRDMEKKMVDGENISSSSKRSVEVDPPAPPPPPPPANEEMLRASRGKEVESLDVIFPNFVFGLTKKEIEEDLLAMTGNKLPIKPNKDTNPSEPTLQRSSIPGLSLADLSKAIEELEKEN